LPSTGLSELNYQALPRNVAHDLLDSMNREVTDQEDDVQNKRQQRHLPEDFTIDHLKLFT